MKGAEGLADLFFFFLVSQVGGLGMKGTFGLWTGGQEIG